MTPHTPKSLLIGASGQLGGQILHLLGPDRCLVTSRQSNSPAGFPLDLASLATADEARRAVDGHPLNAIYCVAGMTNVEGCEGTPELAYNTNCRGPEMLAHLASELAIPLVYFSTEYVFDGLNGPYSEDSPVRPLSVYGKSKQQGEQAVLAACRHALILRTTVVYGQDVQHKNYVYSVIRSLASGKPMRVPEDQISTPTYNRDLAAVTIELVSRVASGIFHVCGPERMNRLEFARAVAKHLGLDTGLLIGVPTSTLGQKAPRPLSAGLTIHKLRRLHPDLHMRPLAEGIAECRPSLEEFHRSCVTLAGNSPRP